MKRLPAFLSFLGTSTLTVWLTGSFILYYLTVAVWSREAFGQFVDNLSHDNLFRLPYLLLFINIAVRSIKGLKAFWPVKSVFFLRLPLYAGGPLLLLAFFLSVNVRQGAWLLAGEGDVLALHWERAKLRVSAVRPALEKNVLATEDSLIFSSEPSITLTDEEGTSHIVGAFPPRKVASTYMHILNFGIGPGVELRERESVLARTYVALRLMPFGSVDTFELPPSPYKFYLSVLPNRVIQKGKETAREYNLENPMYGVEIVKGDRVIAKSETNSAVRFDKNFSLEFFPPSDWVLLDAAYDPFLPWFAAGLLLTGTGMVFFPFSFVFKRKR